MMKEIINLHVSFWKILVIYILALLICVAFLVIPGMSDDQEAKYHIELSSELLEEEGEYPWISVRNNPYYVVDNYSEAIVLNCIYNVVPSDPWKTTLAQRNFATQDDPIGDLRILATGSAAAYGEENWHWKLPYWMGCRSFLRIALNFVDYMTIRGMIQGLVFLLFVIAIVFVGKNCDWYHAAAFGASAILMNIQVSTTVMAQAAMFGLTFLNTILVIYFIKKKKNWLGYIFFLTGIFSVYFDWFTYPVITYAVPMLILLAVMEKSERPDNKNWEYINMVFAQGVLWCLGYGLMLVTKTLLSALFTGDEATSYFFRRIMANAGMTAGAEESSALGIFTALAKCVRGIFPLSFFNMMGIGLILAFAAVLVILGVFKRKNWIYDGCIAFVGMVPIMWIVVFHQFYKVHYWFGYRVLFGTVFAVIVLFRGLLIRNKAGE